jgi:hypothetical protein
MKINISRLQHIENVNVKPNVAKAGGLHLGVKQNTQLVKTGYRRIFSLTPCKIQQLTSYFFLKGGLYILRNFKRLAGDDVAGPL